MKRFAHVVSGLLCVTAGLLASLTTGPAAAQQVAGPAAPKQTYDLRYKFNAGETVRWLVEQRVEFDTTVSGSTQRASTSSKSVKMWTIKTASDKEITFEHSVESVDMWQELSGRARVSYNSLVDDRPPPGFEAVAASIGKPLSTIQMGPHGEVIKREVGYKGPGAAVEQQEKPMALPLPEKPVEVGDSWDLPYDITLTLESGAVKQLRARDHYVLQAVNDGICTISFETQVLTPVRDPAVEAQLVQRAGKGHIHFSLDQGRVLKMQSDTDKKVHGFRGAVSLLHYRARFSEELMRPSAATARRTRRTLKAVHTPDTTPEEPQPEADPK